MDKRKLNKIIGIGAVCAFIGIGTTVAMATPGGSDDPVISKNYVDNVLIPQLTQYVDSKIAGISGGNTGGGAATTSAPTFQVVEVKNGEALIADGGTEMILRMGSGVIVATEKGGIADTTAGYDLANGTEMPSNHLLIVPLNDGRGFIATDDVLVMVKGGYTIK